MKLLKLLSLAIIIILILSGATVYFAYNQGMHYLIKTFPQDDSSSPINPPKYGGTESPTPNPPEGTDSSSHKQGEQKDERTRAEEIISAKLTNADIIHLKNLAKDGLTPEEKKEALTILRARFSTEEFDFLYKRIYLPLIKNRIEN